MRLEWNSGFQADMTQKLNDAQAYVDSECLRLSAPYVPVQTSQLLKSGTLGTVIGSGVVQYIAPYARKNYYENAGHGIQGTANGGQRGRLWFERMKADHKEEILSGARRRLDSK